MQRSALVGLMAGFIGTAVMTAAMKLMYRFLPRNEAYPLPPIEITVAVAEWIGIGPCWGERSPEALTLVLHFAYGSAVGALYLPCASKLPGPILFRGMSFGLFVWAVSYLGWVPATRLLSSATEHPLRRTALMIAAHLVWGASIAELTDAGF